MMKAVPWQLIPPESSGSTIPFDLCFQLADQYSDDRIRCSTRFQSNLASHPLCSLSSSFCSCDFRCISICRNRGLLARPKDQRLELQHPLLSTTMARKRRLGPDPDNPRTPKKRRIEKDDDIPGPFLTPAPRPSAEAYPTPDPTPDSKSTRTLEADRDAQDKPDIPEVEKDEVLRRFSVGQLKRNGYINYREKPVLAISNTFKPEVAANDLSNPVHPVFQRSNWLDTDDATWASLQPSLRLASRVIAEPALQAFFYDIVIRPHYYFDHKELEKFFHRRPTRFGGTAVYEMSFQEHTLKILQQKMSQMRHAIEWGWSSFPNRIHGCTTPSYARPGIGGPEKL